MFCISLCFIAGLYTSLLLLHLHLNVPSLILEESEKYRSLDVSCSCGMFVLKRIEFFILVYGGVVCLLFLRLVLELLASILN